MKKFAAVLRYGLVFLAGAGLMAALFTVGPLTTEKGEYTKLEQLQDLIEERFIGEADATAMEDAAAEAMVDSLGDEWSYYISAADYQSHLEQVQNAYVGVGITITAMEDGYFEIVKVEDNGPAQAAGIQPGDVLIRADGQDCAELGMDGTRNLVRGEEGTTVELTLRRGEEELTLTVERRYFEVTVAEYEMLEGNIGLIHIYNFDERCADETIASIEQALDEGAEKLIFDVRSNPGGYKNELVEVLDYLLPEGPLFISETYSGKQEVDESDANCLEIPMAVLVNEDSYSAAEFFAAALSEYEAAIVVGQQTYGKGYYQQTYRLNDGSAVGLSCGKYFTPNGVSLAGVGITPDVVVEVDDETYLQIYYGNLEPEEDPQIQAAVEALTQGVD